MKSKDIQKLKDKVNLFLYNKYNFGLEKLKLSNKIIEILGGVLNETFINISFN